MDMPGAAQTLKFIHETEKKQIEMEREALKHGSGRTEDASARLRVLDMREESADAMYQGMTEAASLAEGRLSGASPASISAERQAQGPAAELLAQGSSKGGPGSGANISLSLGPSLDLSLGGSSKADGTSVTKMAAQEAAADARLEDRSKPGERDDEPGLVPKEKDVEPDLVPKGVQSTAGTANDVAAWAPGTGQRATTDPAAGSRLAWLAPSAAVGGFIDGQRDIALKIKGL